MGERPVDGPDQVTQRMDASEAEAQRLLYVISTLGGGTGSHLVRLLDELDRASWKAHVLCNGQRVMTPPAHVGFSDDSETQWGHRFPLAQFREIRRMRSLVGSYRPALVHTYFIWPILYGRILKRLGVIRHLVENREDQGFNLTDWEYRALRLTARIPDRVICVSEAVRQVVLDRERMAPERTLVIHNGIALPESGPPDGAQRTRHELGFRADHLVVGMVSNLNRSIKGVKYFIESLPAIAERVPSARFLILGDGREREEHRQRAAALGISDKLVFAGYQPEVQRFYQAMDVSVLTSLSEGLSITILESMSHSVPVVATEVGGNPELVVDGETGLLVPPRQPQVFAEAVIRILEDAGLRESFGRAGRKRIEEHFSLRLVARRYEALYREVLLGDGGAR